MSQSAVLEQEDMQNEQDSVQPDPLLTSPNHTNVNQLPLLQYRNGFFQGHIDEYSQRQGKGVYYWNSGEIYYGDWNQDRMEGEGIFYFAFGGYAYGTFLEDKVHGYAVLCFSNGDYIAGFWERGVLTGKVIQYSKGPDDWCLYEYKDGSPEKVAANGKGKPPISTFSMIESVHLQKLVDRELDIFIPEGGESHLGFLPIGEQGWYHGFSSELGNPHGLGVICHLENKIDRGLFKEGNLDGPGRSIFENGDVYDGFFKGGKFNGAGVYFKSQTEQYLYGVYENSECTQALTLGNGYPHELIRTLKGDFKLEESEYIDKDTDFEVLILSELSRAQSMAEGVDQREWMSISRNAHEESINQSLPLESQRSKNNGGSRGNVEPEKQVASNKNVSSVKSVKSVKDEKPAVSHASNGSNASVKSRTSQTKVASQPQVQPQSQRAAASTHNSRTSVQSKGGKQVESRTSVHEEIVVQQQKSGYSSIESNKKSGQKNPSSEAKSRQQAVSREISERGSAHVSNRSQKEAVNSESNKKSTPVVSGTGNKSSDRNASIGSRRLVEDLQKHDSNVLDANFVNINNKKGGLRESSPEIKRKFTEESPSRHTKSEVLEIHSARSGHSDRLNRKTHETINNEVTNIMDQIFRSGTEPRDSHQTRENPTEQSQGAIYYDLNGSFGSPVKTQQSQRGEHVKRAHLPEHEISRRSEHNTSRQSSRGELMDNGSEIKAKTAIHDRKVEHSKQESYEEEHKDYVDQGLGNQTLEHFIKNLGREVKSEILDGQLSNRLSLRKKTTEGYSEANHHQIVIEEEIYRVMMSKIELLLKEQTRTTERLDEIKRIIDTKLDPLLRNQTQGNQALKRELGEKVGMMAREKDYDSNVDILRKMHQDLVQHTRLSNISLNITHTKLDTLLVAQDIPSPYIGHPDCVLDVPLNQEILSGQLFKSQYDKSMIEAGSAATTLEPHSAFLNKTQTTQIVKEQPKSSHHHAYKVSHQPPAFDEADYMSITSDSAPLKTVNAFTPHAKQLAAKNERMFGEFTPYQSKDSALSQSIVKFRNSIRQATEQNNSSAPENQLSSGNYVLTQTPRDKITYLRTEESVQQSSEPILISHRSHKSSSKNEAAPVTPQRSMMRDSKYSPEKEPNVSPDRREHGGNSTPRPKESTGSNVKDKSRWNLGFCGQSEDIEEPEAFLGPKKFMKTSNVQHQTEESRILQTQGQESHRSHSSQTQNQMRPPQQQGIMKKSNASYKPSSLKLIENLHGSRVEDTQQSHRSQVSQRSQRESARRNDTAGHISDMSVFDHFVVTSNNNRIPSPSAGEYIRIEKGGASQRNMAFMRGQNSEAHRGTQSAQANKYPVEKNLRVREVNVYEEEGSQIYEDRHLNTLPDENGPWRNSVGGNSSYIHTGNGVSPLKIRREPLSAQNPMKNSVHEGRLGSVRWRLELEVDEEFERSPISKRNLVEEILGVDPVEDDINTIQYHKVHQNPQQSIKSSKMVSTTVAGGLTSERNWERQQYVPQEQIHQDIYYVNEGDDPLSSRRSYKMSERSRNYPDSKVVYPAQALENMAVMRTHPDDYIEKVVNREVSTRKSGNSKKSSYNVIEDEDYANHSNRLENVQIKAWDQGLIDNLNNRGQNQNNIRVYKNQYQHM